jgi:hypothetical protein
MTTHTNKIDQFARAALTGEDKNIPVADRMPKVNLDDIREDVLEEDITDPGIDCTADFSNIVLRVAQDALLAAAEKQAALEGKLAAANKKIAEQEVTIRLMKLMATGSSETNARLTKELEYARSVAPVDRQTLELQLRDARESISKLILTKVQKERQIEVLNAKLASSGSDADKRDLINLVTKMRNELHSLHIEAHQFRDEARCAKTKLEELRAQDTKVINKFRAELYGSAVEIDMLKKDVPAHVIAAQRAQSVEEELGRLDGTRRTYS